MSVKPSGIKSPRKKAPVNKMSLSRLALIICALIIILAFILYSISSPKSKKTKDSQPATSIHNTPAFRMDGQVKVITGNGPVTIDVEVADSDAERTQGLMYRYSMKENQGMYFIFPEENFRSFWMKNTFISLDIIFINADHEIVSIQKYTQPKSTYSQPSEKPAKYVLEVNAGFADKYGLKPGDRIEF